MLHVPAPLPQPVKPSFAPAEKVDTLAHDGVPDLYVFSVAHELQHPSTHVERERKEHMMSRLQPQHSHQEGLALWTPWTLWHTGGSRQGHPRYTGARQGRPWMARRNLHETTNDKRHQDTDKPRDTRAFSNKCRHTLGISHRSGAARQSHGKRAVNEYDVDSVTESKWRCPGSSRRSRTETEPITPEKINHKTGNCHSESNDAQKELEKETR